MINTFVAEALCQFADELEKADDFDKALDELLVRTIKEHKRVIFNGDGYSKEWEEEAERRGLPNLKSVVDAVPYFTEPRAVKIFEKHGVLTEIECNARAEVTYEDYAKKIDIEAKTAIQMASKEIMPAVMKYAKEIADTVRIPCLRKDFTVDEYMIYEAKVLGASAVLLICSILTGDTIREYIRLCDELGLSALVEAHDETEVDMAVQAGARIIGVNNRNLKDFSVDTENSARLRSLIPKDVLFVSESGVKSAEDIAKLRAVGADAVLIGETLMRAADKKAKLDELRGAL